jgi:parvulin-like peptidyl-prolyl isomerase
MKRIAFIGVLALLVGCGESPTVVPATAIAVVGDRAIPRADFDAQMSQARRVFRAQGKPFPSPGTPEYERLKDTAVRLLVERMQMTVAARRLGILPRVTSQVAPALRRFKQTTLGGSEARYRERLRQTGMTDRDVREAITDQLLASALKRAKASPLRKPLSVSYAKGFAPAADG